MKEASKLIRRQETLQRKKMQVRGLEGLLEEWESVNGEWDEERENYIRHLKAKLNAAKNGLKSMGI